MFLSELVPLSSSVKIFGVSDMRDFYIVNRAVQGFVIPLSGVLDCVKGNCKPSPKAESLAWRYGGKGSPTISDEAVYRTAPATLGLLIINLILVITSTFFHEFWAKSNESYLDQPDFDSAICRQI